MMVGSSSTAGGGVATGKKPGVTPGANCMSSDGAGVAVGVMTPDPPETSSPFFTLTQRTWPSLQAVW